MFVELRLIKWLVVLWDFALNRNKNKAGKMKTLLSYGFLLLFVGVARGGKLVIGPPNFH